MFDAIRTVIRNMVTGADNTTHDVVRIIAALCGPAGLFYQGWDVIAQHAHFDIQQFGIGVGAMLTGIGAALGLKRDTEPKPPQGPQP